MGIWASPDFVDRGWGQQSFLLVALRERLIPKKLGIISYGPV